ncbi:MAG TPA: hypothetical protein VJQ80_06140 [Arthrobacter sp.]|nr:hypothetical protein [Arthrobacter sp.]
MTAQVYPVGFPAGTGDGDGGTRPCAVVVPFIADAGVMTCNMNMLPCF